MSKSIDKNINIIFNKMYNLTKLNKYTEKEIVEILFKDMKFINAFISLFIYSAIRYEINKILKECV